jgi:hypothetical protein
MIGITTMGKHTNSASTGTGNLDIKFSTRYQDRESMAGTSVECKLDLLTGRLIAQINACVENIIALEALQDDIHDDGVKAKADDNIGYMMRYLNAFAYTQLLFAVPTL